MEKWKLLFFCASLFLSTQIMALPTITKISPKAFGPSRTALSPEITITGTAFLKATDVHFGSFSVPSKDFIVNGDTSITVKATALPPSSPETVCVTVTADETSLPNHPFDYFTYQDEWLAFVPDFNGGGKGNVYVFKAKTDEKIAAISTGSGSEAVSVTPDGKFAFCVNYSSRTLSIMNTALNTEDSTISFSLAELATNPIALAISPGDGHILLISDYRANSIIQLDITDRENPRYVSTYKSGLNPVAVAFLPNAQTLTAFTTNFGSKSITVIDPIKKAVIGDYTDQTLQNPSWIAFTTTNTSTKLSREDLFIQNTNDSGAMVLDNTLGKALFYSRLVPPGPEIPVSLAGFALNQENFFPQILPSPDSTIAYVTNTQSGNISRIDLTGPTPVLLPENIPTPKLVNGISLTPDGLRGFAGNGSSPEKIIIFDTTTLKTTSQTIGNEITNPGITPDQAPVAYMSFSFLNDTTVQFDASDSLSPTGTVSKYIWDFGDGSLLLTTTSPRPAPHTYVPRSQPYTVTLTVINSAGTSLNQTYFGQMTYNNGGPQAMQSLQLTVSSLLPPINIQISQTCKQFLTQDCFYNKICFSPPLSGIPPVGYLIYQDEERTHFVAQIAADGPLCFSICEPKKHHTYYLFSIGSGGTISSGFAKVSI